MDAIPVSKRHGVNPSLAVCMNCGKETGEILLIGRCDKFVCLSCRQVVYGSAPRTCPKCGSCRIALAAKDVEAPWRIPAGLCDTCAKMFEESKALVRQGGVFWKCKKCGSVGAVRPGTYLALMVRHKMGVVAPKPCGIKFTKEQCPVCGRKGAAV